MARMISELNNRQAASRPRDPARASSPDSSIMSADNSQVEAYGSAGLQLFVDAGQPVNPELVNDLVRDVLEEKIAAMLGQRQREPMTPSRISTEPQPAPEPTFAPGSPIPTPEVTPKSSPVHTPPKVGSPIATPDASIAESSLIESEPDSLKESMVLPETPREATPAPLPAPSSPVTTPAATPPPIPPKAPTPELSPRGSPVPLLLDETDLPTPEATLEHFSPEPEPEPEEEKVEETPHRSPTPAAPITPVPPTPSPLPSLPVESIVTESEVSPDVTTASASETVGKDISEGEWLISKSEGQVDLIQDALAAKQMKLFDTTSADSTMRGTEDIERDLTLQEPPSEGEILPGKFRKFNLADDPVVALLARLGEPMQSTPQYRPPVSRRPTDNEARSPGEVSLGQRPSFSESTERFVIEQVETEAAEGGIFEEVREIRLRLSPGELETSRREKRNANVVNNQQGSDSTLRISHLQGTNGQNSNPAILVGSNVDTSDVNKSPVKKEESKPSDAVVVASPRPAPRVINVTAPRPRVIQVGGGSPDREEGEFEVSGASGGEIQSLDASGMTPVEDLPIDQEEASSTKRKPMPAGGVFGTQTMSDFGGTRTMTPDAINIDALLQSGYLSRTFSQSEPDNSDFERTGGTYGATGGDLRMTSGATPFGATQTMTEDSLELPKMKPEKGPRTFSVTLPSAQGMQDGGDSSEGDVAQLDTISDVSEISAGDL